MTCSIHWRPSKEVSARFNGGTSRTLEVLKDTFGSEIGPKDIETLRAMARAANDKFYDEVADTVEKYDAISFWGEW